MKSGVSIIASVLLALAASIGAAAAQGLTHGTTQQESGPGSAPGSAPNSTPGSLLPYKVVGDAIPDSLTGRPGDPARGRAIVVKRENTCLLCHSGPFPEERFQGDLSPNLKGTGSRWNEGELRLRMVDASRLNPATIMPSFYKVDGLNRVAAAWRGKPILTAEQIEDVVAYLKTLKD